MVNHVPVMILYFWKLFVGYSKHVLDASEPGNGFSGSWHLSVKAVIVDRVHIEPLAGWRLALKESLGWMEFNIVEGWWLIAGQVWSLVIDRNGDCEKGNRRESSPFVISHVRGCQIKEGNHRKYVIDLSGDIQKGCIVYYVLEKLWGECVLQRVFLCFDSSVPSLLISIWSMDKILQYLD